MRYTWLFLLAIWSVSCLQPPGIRYPGLPTSQEGALHIISFDVGQADATLIFYKGKSLLVDCGAPLHDPLRASQRIPRRLDALIGTRQLDYFMISHYHQDHFGAPGRRKNQRQPSGIYSLIERDGVTIDVLLDRGFWTVTGNKGPTQKKYENHLRQWLESGVVRERRQVRAGDHIDLGTGLDIEVITAAGNGYLDRMRTLFPSFIAENPPSENDYSIGLKLTKGSFEFFTAGDLTGRNVVRRFGPMSQSYNDIESSIAKKVGAVEVYRVNHHGSRNSSNRCFTDVLHPMVSVFSTGPNSYGHPDLDLYQRLKTYGDVFVTGGVDPENRDLISPSIVHDDVEILVSPDGQSFWVNGQPYAALSDAQETAQPDRRFGCTEADSAVSVEQYEYLKGPVPSD